MWLRHVLLLLVLVGLNTACVRSGIQHIDDAGASDASSDAGPPDSGVDAGPADSGVDAGQVDGGPADAAGIEYVDWRGVRGDDLVVGSIELGDETLFGVTSNQVVLQNGCDAGACDYRWMNLDGGVTVEGLGWRSQFPSSPISPDGRRMVVLEQAAVSMCETPETVHLTRSEGTLRLIDLETGQALTSLPNYGTYNWSEPHFTSRGGWFRLLPVDGPTCGSVTEALRRTNTPYDPGAAFHQGDLVESELVDGRWLSLTNREELTAVDPDSGQSVSIVHDQDTHFVGGGWVHGTSRYPTRLVGSLDPDDGHHDWSLSVDSEWYPLAGWGRWTAFSGRFDPTTRTRPYLFHDMQGTFADVEIQLGGTRKGQGLTFLGKADLLVLTEHDENQVAGARSIDLRTGQRQTISERAFKQQPIGDGEAVILYDSQGALLVERSGVTPLTEGVVSEVYSVGVPATSVPLPQRELAFIVRSVEVGRFALDVLNLRERRLTTLTDWLHWAPVVGGVGYETSCGRPWVTRPIGEGQQSLRTPSETLFFAEYPPTGGPGSLYVMPADLSTPPRLVDRMAPVYCSAPLQSLNGGLLAVLIEGYDTAPRRWLKFASMAPGEPASASP